MNGAITESQVAKSLHYTTQKLYLKKKRSKNKARTAGVGIHW